MSFKLKPLSQQVIVVTGATSGIGLETARRLAKKGSQIVLVSRSEDVLAQVQQEIETDGGRASFVVADVGDRAQLETVAKTTVAKYGRIDTWINNAGIGIFGRLEEISDEDHRRMFDTNFWGLVNGSLVATKYLKRFGGGKLINLGSVAADVGFPLQAMYAASKHAIKGFTDGLRMELEAEKAGISVTLIKPSAIGTPFGNDAKNYLAQEAQLPPPLYDVGEVANAIAYAATHHIRDIYVGGGGRLISGFNQIAPGFVDLMLGRQVMKMSTKNEPARVRHDNLFQSASRGNSYGHDLAHRPMKSLYTRAIIHPWTALSIAFGTLALVAVAKRKA